MTANRYSSAFSAGQDVEVFHGRAVPLKFASIEAARQYLNDLAPGRFMLTRHRAEQWHPSGGVETVETFYVQDLYEGYEAYRGVTLSEAVAKAEDSLRAMAAHG